MRKGEAFNKGKEDGRAGREPNPVGGKTAYFIGYNQGRLEWDQLEFNRKFNERMSGQ